jgi:hypothetical protein
MNNFDVKDKNVYSNLSFSKVQASNKKGSDFEDVILHPKFESPHYESMEAIEKIE